MRLTFLQTLFVSSHAYCFNLAPSFTTKCRVSTTATTSFHNQRYSINYVRLLSSTRKDDSIPTNELVNNGRNYTQILQIAETAAKKAGELMLQTYGNIDVLNTKANTRDIVTVIDFECQEIIKKIIEDNFPQDLFLGEEDDEVNDINDISKKSSLLWIVDPIDGTTNFQSGIPLFSASIGVYCPIRKEVVVGVIYNPILNELVTAIRNEGCWLNGKPLKNMNNQKVDIKQSIINIGHPVVLESTLKASSRAVTILGTNVRGIRMIASASQALSWVAQGKLHGYVSWNLNSWDVAAGMLIVEESGGYVRNFEGKRASVIEDRDLINTSFNGGEALNEDLRKILGDAGCLVY